MLEQENNPPQPSPADLLDRTRLERRRLIVSLLILGGGILLATLIYSYTGLSFGSINWQPGP